MESRLEIASLNPDDLKDFDSIEEIQKQAWIGLRDRDVIPTHFMVAIAAAGGQILLGRLAEKNVAFSLAIPAATPKVLYSHMLAVLPDFQGRGIGQELKLAQRNYARLAGYSRIDWTFSPMLTNNAFLNIAKLGAKCTEFYSNRYGCIQNGLYGSLATDRLKVEWNIEQEHKTAHQEGIIDVIQIREAVPSIDRELLAEAKQKGFIACSVPSNFTEMMVDKPELATEWQRIFSTVAKLLLAPKGLWEITNISPPCDNRCRYVFERNNSSQ